MHITYAPPRGRLFFRENAADLEVLATDTVRFIPMDLGSPYPTIGELDQSLTLHLPPAPAAVRSTQEAPDANSAAFGNDFDVFDLADQLEVHARPRRVE